MTDEWRRYEVSDLIDQEALEIGDGYRATNAELSSTGLPFARARNIGNGFWFSGSDVDYVPEDAASKLGKKVSRPGDVVFTSKGTVGRCAFVKHDTPRFVYSPQLCYWRSRDENVIDPRFLYYWMASHEFRTQVYSVASQTDMAEYVSLGDQRRMHLTAPLISEQRAIGHVLGALDDKIDLNRRMNGTLEAMARALYTSWFVDFDPVRAKQAGRDTGFPAQVAALFPDHLVDSASGRTPAEWRIGTLADVAVSQQTSADPAELSDDTPYIGLEHMPRRSVALTDWQSVGSVSSRKSVLAKATSSSANSDPTSIKSASPRSMGCVRRIFSYSVQRRRNYRRSSLSVFHHRDSLPIPAEPQPVRRCPVRAGRPCRTIDCACHRIRSQERSTTS